MEADEELVKGYSDTRRGQSSATVLVYSAYSTQLQANFLWTKTRLLLYLLLNGPDPSNHSFNHPSVC